MATSTTDQDDLREEVRRHYAAAVTGIVVGTSGSCCGPESADASESTDAAAAADATCCGEGGCAGVSADTAFGADLYTAEDRSALPDAAALASMGCGNPTAVADLQPGDRVLDLGSGGGIDVLLSARRVGATGSVVGIDMTDEMLALARRNAAQAGATNVDFIKGTIEEIPLPDADVDVIISNCVINLSGDKAAVLAEMHRVLRPGGRVGVSDVVAEDRLTPAERAERGDHVGCIAGALSAGEYRDGLAAAGFADIEITFTHEVADGLHGAIVRAHKPGP